MASFAVMTAVAIAVESALRDRPVCLAVAKAAASQSARVRTAVTMAAGATVDCVLSGNSVRWTASASPAVRLTALVSSAVMTAVAEAVAPVLRGRSATLSVSAM